MDPFNTDVPQASPNAYQWHREQARKSNDTIRVLNPTNQDYFVEWDNFRHRIPAQSTLDCPRYIAQKYVREMTVKLINEYVEVEGNKLLARAGKEKPEILLDKYLENKMVWDKMPKTDDPKLTKQYYDQLWLGIVHEFGLDDLTDQDLTRGEVDLKTNEEKLLEAMGNKRIILEPDPIPTKEDSLKEVTADVA